MNRLVLLPLALPPVVARRFESTQRRAFPCEGGYSVQKIRTRNEPGT